MAFELSCTITVDDLRAAWREWLDDDEAEVPDHLLARVEHSRGFIGAAMRDAGLEMAKVLLVDQAMGGN